LNSPSWDDVEEKVRDQVGQLGTIYSGSLHEAEVVDHWAANEPVRLIDFGVVSTSDGQIEVVAKVTMTVEFEVQYEDTDYATYDHEDDTYIGAERATQTFEEEVTIGLFITITNDKIVDVEISTRDLHLEEPYENYK
jgi:hypothetical protein